MRYLPVLALLLACDADHDGAIRGDCDPKDPLIYPGAPDLPRDGVDADCDGEDPNYAFVGTWTLTRLYAEVFSIEALYPDGTGTLTVGDDLQASLNISATIKGELVGFDLPVIFEMTGAASAVPNSQASTIYTRGQLLGEKVNGDLECDVVAPGEMQCSGALKALDTNFSMEGDFVAE